LKVHFNIYHFFAGAFVPSWLLSRQEIGAGAKLTYAMLAQQVNSKGIAQLNFQMQGVALGESDGQLARYLAELEEVGLLQISRGNVHVEDIRVFFPHHHWMIGLESAAQEDAPAPTAAREADPSPRLFSEDDVPVPVARQQPTQSATRASPPQQREGRSRRRRRKPQSRHSFEVCLQFVTYQKEVLHRDSIWNVTGLARHLYLSSEQDTEIDAWLAEHALNAA
jgi:hypothetical protein